MVFELPPAPAEREELGRWVVLPAARRRSVPGGFAMAPVGEAGRAVVADSAILLVDL